MSIMPQNCTVFVQVWVDVDGLQQGSSSGCYAVSNRCDNACDAGTANLATRVATGSNVCWAVLPIDPQYTGDFTITNFGAESGWAQPPAPVSGNVFTGQVAKSTVGGTINSNLQFSYNGSNRATVTLPITIVPGNA